MVFSGKEEFTLSAEESVDTIFRPLKGAITDMRVELEPNEITKENKEFPRLVGNQLRTTVSIGVSVGDKRDGDTFMSTLAQADGALYNAKVKRNTVTPYTPETEDTIKSSL